ncbi:hypothetical protein D3C72_1218060 [compost metagenome]
MLEGEHLAGAGEATLDFIDDQRDTRLFSDPPHTAQPVQIRRNHPALALHHFHDHRRRQLHTSLGIIEQVFQVTQVGFDPLRAAEPERAAVIVRVRHELHAAAKQGAQGLFRPQTAHQAQRALTHAVIATLERDHGAATSGGTHQFQCRFHGVGAGRAAKLDLRFSGQGRRQQPEQILDEPVLDRRGQVQGVQRQLIGQHLLDGFDHHRVVVPQGQGSGSGQAIDEGAAFDIFDVDALGALECQGNASRIAAGVGFLPALTGEQWRFVELIKRLGGRRRLLFDKVGSD